MPLAREELLGTLKEALARRPEVLEAYLFGSRASGLAQPHSDVDVALYVAEVPETPFGYEAQVAGDLIAALGENRVDVVLLDRAPPLLYHRVLREGIRILSRDARATTVREGRALSRYCDYLPQLAKLDAVFHARFAGGELGQ